MSAHKLPLPSVYSNYSRATASYPSGELQQTWSFKLISAHMYSFSPRRPGLLELIKHVDMRSKEQKRGKNKPTRVLTLINFYIYSFLKVHVIGLFIYSLVPLTQWIDMAESRQGAKLYTVEVKYMEESCKTIFQQQIQVIDHHPYYGTFSPFFYVFVLSKKSQEWSDLVLFPFYRLVLSSGEVPFLSPYC